MTVIVITPGSGEHFYCENCRRDLDLARALGAQGHDAVLLPLYLPIRQAPRTPVFYGAVNVYLSQRLPGYRFLPGSLRRCLDGLTVLRLASAQARSTRSRGLEDLTLSMLKGEDGRQAEELDRLVQWLRQGTRPDVVHLSNALLLGLAGRIRRDVGVPVVCSLQDEDTWIDPMPESWRTRVWETLADKASDVDLFLPVSAQYGERMRAALRLPPEAVRVVYPGIDCAGYPPSPAPAKPVMGYYARLSRELGLELFVDAFLGLRKRPGLEQLRLLAAGGMTADDQATLRRVRRRLRAAGAEGNAAIVEDFDAARRAEIMEGLTVLSVPAPRGEAFGLFAVEALAHGVPVVLPRAGAFPELLERTGGGVLCEPGSADSLADALAPVLLDPALRARLAAEGREGVRRHFDLATCTVPALLAAYREAIGRRGRGQAESARERGTGARSAAADRSPGNDARGLAGCRHCSK
ncbi:MAG: glycosyltransferase family 4 protein [Lentisphaeria bacterium]|nr:glycosyltransferase family 4 protein [Lentisphaeria bacterium]